MADNQDALELLEFYIAKRDEVLREAREYIAKNGGAPTRLMAKAQEMQVQIVLLKDIIGASNKKLKLFT